MKDKEIKEVEALALDTYGFGAQLMMLVEECGELLGSVAKFVRGRVGKDDVITELADVSIIIDQMILYYGELDFLKEKERKLSRLKKRLEKHS